MSPTRLLFAFLLAVPMVHSLPASAAYDHLYAFGDSLSDDGNLFELTGGLYPPPPYFGGRLSNGPVAVEYLADSLGIGLTNLSVAGARTGAPPGGIGSDNYIDDDNTFFPENHFNGTGVTAQVDGFVSNLGPARAGASSLYFIWAGPNDYFLLANAAAGPVDPTPLITNAIGNLQYSVGALYAAGARDFLIPNMPNLGLTPELRELGSEAALAAAALSSAHNDALAQLLEELDAALPDASFRSADAYGMTTAAFMNPAAYGFTNVTGSCVESVPCIGLNGQGYLFWDGVHVTTAAHERLAGSFAAALAPVPEVQTWAMLLAGIGLIGAARRFRRTA